MITRMITKIITTMITKMITTTIITTSMMITEEVSLFETHQSRRSVPASPVFHVLQHGGEVLNARLVFRLYHRHHNVSQCQSLGTKSKSIHNVNQKSLSQNIPHCLDVSSHCWTLSQCLKNVPARLRTLQRQLLLKARHLGNLLLRLFQLRPDLQLLHNT